MMIQNSDSRVKTMVAFVYNVELELGSGADQLCSNIGCWNRASSFETPSICIAI